jgi:uncharacterized protein YsxB (DUF464 family)
MVRVCFVKYTSDRKTCRIQNYREKKTHISHPEHFLSFTVLKIIKENELYEYILRLTYSKISRGSPEYNDRQGKDYTLLIKYHIFSTNNLISDYHSYIHVLALCFKPKGRGFDSR